MDEWEKASERQQCWDIITQVVEALTTCNPLAAFKHFSNIVLMVKTANGVCLLSWHGMVNHSNICINQPNICKNHPNIRKLHSSGNHCFQMTTTQCHGWHHSEHNTSNETQQGFAVLCAPLYSVFFGKHFLMRFSVVSKIPTVSEKTMQCLSVAPAGLRMRLDPAHVPPPSSTLLQTAYPGERESSFARFCQT